MRADRLVAVLLLLQQRGQVTAAEVAAELEVSERTARRDLDGLALAGLPVYSVQGRGGGWRLAGGGRTDLSGLTADEARALFTVTGPQVTPEVKAALRKLARALPEPLRERAEAAQRAVAVDPSTWDRTDRAERTTGGGPDGYRSLRFLDPLQRAVVEREQVRLGYRDRAGARTTRTVHPLGLGAKGATWYLVAGTEAGRRSFRVDRVTSVVPLGVPAERPDDFDLDEVWRSIVRDVDRLRTPLIAHGLVDPPFLGPLRWVLGTRVAVGPQGGDGRVPVELRGHTVASLAAELAGFAGPLEVTDPPELRRALLDTGTRLVERYGDAR